MAFHSFKEAIYYTKCTECYSHIRSSDMQASYIQEWDKDVTVLNILSGDAASTWSGMFVCLLWLQYFYWKILWHYAMCILKASHDFTFAVLQAYGYTSHLHMFGSYVVEHFLAEGQVMFVILLLLRPHDFNWSNSFVEHSIVWNIHDISILLLNRTLFHVNNVMFFVTICCWKG